MVGVIASPPGDPAAWQDVECGGYAADLPVWRELAAARGAGGVLELGSGCGRVALDLARLGHGVAALDHDPRLTAALRDRAAAAGLRVAVHEGDATGFDLDRAFSLVIAAMQLAQVLGGQDRLPAMLNTVRRHLLPQGLFALALADARSAAVSAGDEAANPLPDVREVAGWTLASMPLAVEPAPGGVVVRRLRQAVSPTGELLESRHEHLLTDLAPAVLERAARATGYRQAGRREIPPTTDHVGSDVVLLEAA